jgi:2-methylisocitrate lyase-like PEP mutase family enzyme
MNVSTSSAQSPGNRMRAALRQGQIKPFIGVYDVFSAGLAGRHYDALFLIGFITWSDMVSYVQRSRTVLPAHHLLVDIDDGYTDPDVACHVVSVLEASGASGVVLEDQKRPRRCGHFDGKQIMDLDDYLAKLRQVLATRRDLFVIARTDSSDPADIERRVLAFGEAGADAVLVDGLTSLDSVRRLSAKASRPFCFNQISGGKSPALTLTELRDAGVQVAIYSTPCLFAAQAAIEGAMTDLKNADGSLEGSRVGVKDCTRILSDSLARRAAPQITVQASDSGKTAK